jgi:hypothetical protein
VVVHLGRGPLGERSIRQVIEVAPTSDRPHVVLASHDSRLAPLSRARA